MDVWRITLAALRRWYVLLPLLAITGVAVVMVGKDVAPEYEAKGSALIAPERAAGEIPNPYGGINSANEVLSIVLNGVESRAQISDLGLASYYEVSSVTRTGIIQFSARGPDPDVVVETGDAVFDLAVQELSDRQTEAGLPPSAQYTLDILEPPAVVGAVQTGKARTQAVVGVVGAALSLLVAVLFDDIVGLFKRRRRASRKTTSGVGRSATPQTGRDVADHPHAVAPTEADAMVHTDQWVWPDEHRPVPSGRPRRNPYFDPEFTKRSLAKLMAATEPPDNGQASESTDLRVAADDEPASASEAARRS